MYNYIINLTFGTNCNLWNAVKKSQVLISWKLETFHFIKCWNYVFRLSQYTLRFKRLFDIFHIRKRFLHFSHYLTDSSQDDHWGIIFRLCFAYADYILENFAFLMTKIQFLQPVVHKSSRPLRFLHFYSGGRNSAEDLIKKVAALKCNILRAMSHFVNIGAQDGSGSLEWLDDILGHLHRKKQEFWSNTWSRQCMMAASRPLQLTKKDK